MSDKKGKKPAKVKTKAKDEPVKKKAPTKQQQVFIDELPTAKNQTDAARKAGFANPEKEATRLLNKPHIAEAVEVKREEIRQQYELTEQRIIDELLAIAFTNANDVMTWKEGDMAMIPSNMVDGMAVRAVESIAVTHTEFGGTIAMKRYDKVGALKILAQILGMTKDARRKPDNGSKQAALERIRGLTGKRQG